ncbi:MAG: TVP38/TMEM64 family protein [Alphaproteobacteria bacterium]
MCEPSPAPKAKGNSIRRFLPVLLLAAGLVLFFVFGLDHYVSFEMLQENREWLRAQVEANEFLAAMALIALYVVVIAFSLPAGAVLTIAAGFLFGTVVAAACVVVGATVGAMVVFLAARTAFADILRAKAGAGMRRMEAGFRENAWNYLLVLRLIPIFPFWLVNLVPAFLGVSLFTYVTATFIGIIPGTVVFASLGNGLGAIFAAGETPDLSIIFNSEVLLPILALAILAVVPVVYKKVKARKAAPR